MAYWKRMKNFNYNRPLKFPLTLAILNFVKKLLLLILEETFHVKHQEELDEHDGYCADCVPPPLPIFEPEPETISLEPIQNDQTIVTIEVFETLQQRVVQQSKTIKQLQQQVQKLENFNQQLLRLIHQDTQYLQQRTKALTTFLTDANF